MDKIFLVTTHSGSTHIDSAFSTKELAKERMEQIRLAYQAKGVDVKFTILVIDDAYGYKPR